MSFLSKIFKFRSAVSNPVKAPGVLNDTHKLQVYHEDRPWGSFERFTHNQESTVKIITVHKGQATSLQYHHHRCEYYVVLSGKGKFYIGENVFDSEKGKMYEVPLGTLHRIEGSQDEDLTFMEISIGDFDEADIVRLKDSYGRLSN